DGLANEADFPWDTDGYRAPQSEFIDAITFDGRKPNAYLDSFPIGLKSGEVISASEVVSQ
ncbi:MAG TPA: nitrate ABC transporter substrate-binding protein, partial [Alphaproteobacteria bacterium]|nr:nitrate ABC transporter substrate-binding protein [Alphaproteobacteria bacterium]HBC55230.1 nitrate ABC transporter substrate-binding protein [Alphaproteobacteria bacterium]